MNRESISNSLVTTRFCGPGNNDGTVSALVLLRYRLGFSGQWTVKMVPESGVLVKETSPLRYRSVSSLML